MLIIEAVFSSTFMYLIQLKILSSSYMNLFFVVVVWTLYMIT